MKSKPIFPGRATKKKAPKTSTDQRNTNHKGANTMKKETKYMAISLSNELITEPVTKITDLLEMNKDLQKTTQENIKEKIELKYNSNVQSEPSSSNISRNIYD